MSERGAGPLEWRTVGGYTPESVRRASIVHVFPAAAVADMLKAADEAHIKRLNEENERGGEARGVVADVASVLDVDIDHGPGTRWDADHMHRVVVGAQALRDDLESMNSYSARIERERDELKAKQATTADLLRAEYERANAAIEREEAADEAAAEIGQYARRMERERDEHRKAAEEAEAKLRKQEHGCETPESHAYGCPCDEPIKFRGGSITLHQDPVTAEIRFEAGPWDRTMWFIEETDPEVSSHGTLSVQRAHRTVGVRIDGRVWMEFLRAASTVDPGSKALRERLAELDTSAEYWGANAPGGSLIDDLKNTIVSQAREIARLKGESA